MTENYAKMLFNDAFNKDAWRNGNAAPLMYETVLNWKDASALRSVCINNDYFNCADNDEYYHFFEMVAQCPTNNKRGIYAIACYILAFSDNIYCYGSEAEAIESILFTLYNDCMYTTINTFYTK